MGRLRAKLIDLGLAPDMPPEFTVIVRATNVAALTLAAASLAAIAMALVDGRNPALALGFAALLVLYLGIVFLNAASYSLVARVGFVVVACIHYGAAELVLGV